MYVFVGVFSFIHQCIYVCIVHLLRTVARQCVHLLVCSGDVHSVVYSRISLMKYCQSIHVCIPQYLAYALTH